MANDQGTRRVVSLRKGLRRRSELLAAAVRPPGRGGRPLVVRSKAPRLVESPVFVLSCQRSGSTLLRVLLNSHSQIRAPHELHLRYVRVQLAEFQDEIMGELGLDRRELEHMLWDRILHHEMARSGKQLIVEKTPSNSYNWKRLEQAWPNTRFIFLLRHPASIVGSIMNRRGGAVYDDVVAEVLRHAEGLEQAREARANGITVRYEDLTAGPERETRRLCEFLGVEWEPSMLEYGQHDHGPFKGRFGDWSSNIKSGRIQPARELAPDEQVPDKLVDIARAWGYLD